MNISTQYLYDALVQDRELEVLEQVQELIPDFMDYVAPWAETRR